MKLAFVGQPAVGKDALAIHIEKKFNLTHVSSGDIIRDYVRKNNLGELDRKNLQIIGNKLRTERGGDVLVRMALEQNPDNVVISGLRAIDEVETFKRLGGTIIVVTAPIEKRFEWAKARGRIDDNTSFEDFKKIEDDEKVNIDRNGQNVDKVIAMADIEIVNNGSLEDLFRISEETIRNLK